MRKTYLFVSLVCVFVSACALGIGGDMGGADPNGSPEKPYLIEDLADFDTFAADPNYWAAGVHTKLMTDIDLVGRTYTTAVIAPDTDPNSSGFQGTYFGGTFYGNNHTMLNLNIVSSTGDYIGVFGSFSGIVMGLGVENISISSNGSYVGGIAGESLYGDIINCYVTGSVSGADFVGGMAGKIGPLVFITQCYVSGSISGIDYVGGLVGGMAGSTFIRCYTSVSIIATNYIGGMTGGLWTPSHIYNCYSSGSITGTNMIRGFAGKWDLVNIAAGHVDNCYASVAIEGSDSIGGFYGTPPLKVITEYCFWDVDVSGIGSSSDNFYGAIGKTTAQMQTQSTFINWDFDPGDGDPADWMMLRESEDYPRLAWKEVFAGDIAGLYGVDIVDFAEIARNWQNTGCPANCEDADIDGSGDVGLGDLVFVTDDWMK